MYWIKSLGGGGGGGGGEFWENGRNNINKQHWFNSWGRFLELNVNFHIICKSSGVVGIKNM